MASVENGIVSFTKGVMFRIDHAYGQLLRGKDGEGTQYYVVTGGSSRMAIYGNDSW